METVVAEQIRELKTYMPLTELQQIYIEVALKIAFMEGERAQMVKQLNDLKK